MSVHHLSTPPSLLAADVCGVLAAHLVSPARELLAACAALDVDARRLTAADLHLLIPLLGERVARVTDLDHGVRVMHRLAELGAPEA